jgi:hypothetical protein
MKKITLLSLVCFSALLFMASCKKSKISEASVPPTAAHFTNKTGASFFVQNTANSTFKIPIGLTAPVASDTKVTVTVTSPTGAAAGVQYNLPSSTITIPAGQTLDSLTVQGIFAGFPGSRVDTLVFKISGGDVEAAPYNDTYKLVLRKVCPVVFATLAGNYSNTNEYFGGAFQYGPYVTGVSNLVSTGATTATGQITNIYDDGWNAINVVFDWTDPANFKVSIPLQPTGKSYNGAPTSVRSSSGQPNTFSSCDRTVTLTIDLVNGGTPILTNYQIQMK